MNSGKSLFLDGYMALFCNFYVWIPFLLSILYLLIKNNSIQDFLEILLLNCCMLLVVYLLTSYAIMPVTEYLLSWCYDLPADVYDIEKWGSLFLLQIASTTSLTIFLSIIIRHGTLSFSFILWCLLSCVSCMYFAAGGLLEIVASLFTGIICGTLTYRVHRYTTQRETRLDKRPLHCYGIRCIRHLFCTCGYVYNFCNNPCNIVLSLIEGDVFVGVAYN